MPALFPGRFNSPRAALSHKRPRAAKSRPFRDGPKETSSKERPAVRQLVPFTRSTKELLHRSSPLDEARGHVRFSPLYRHLSARRESARRRLPTSHPSFFCGQRRLPLPSQMNLSLPTEVVRGASHLPCSTGASPPPSG